MALQLKNNRSLLIGGLVCYALATCSAVYLFIQNLHESSQWYLWLYAILSVVFFLGFINFILLLKKAGKQ